MKTYKIVKSDIKDSERFTNSIESIVLSWSDKQKLMGKFTTGFGWYNNLRALYSMKLVDLRLFKLIKITHDFFSNLYVGQTIPLDCWEKHVLLQRTVMNMLSSNTRNS
ncbi:hypothetical protein J18TS1_11720 [Oceanobacillus oncorhynchi subsp. incaldanensis]|uniref:hypothetical protein n=1 Tax=Oceanobacillus oncorhynchi TaxID=545501 RepID=UPI001B2A7C96|nr:hypothetical protein [Oceanobacillus oncorhynchi]GIO18072.1 hypothetical protein J18TS1_11720 [Oceanobacillus oncorhynchi subsp. incaldanensis]